MFDTGIMLRRLRIALVAAAVLTALASLTVFEGARRTVASVRASTVPAIQQVVAAQGALAAADLAVIGRFRDRTVKLVGPVEYRNELAVAGRSLQQVAEANADGNLERQRLLRLVNGLLVAYGGLVEQARVRWVQDQGQLAAASLVDASRLMHAPNTGILATLDTLREQGEQELRGQRETVWLSGWAVLGWALPAGALLALLVMTQVVLSRRFRRTFNLPLLGACLLLVALAVVSLFPLRSEQRLGDSQQTLGDLVSKAKSWQHTQDSQGVDGLGELVRNSCGPGADCRGLAATIAAELTVRRDLPTPSDRCDFKCLTQAAETTVAQFDAANNTYYFEIVIPTTGVLIMALILLGLYPRIDEYRYQPQ